MVDKSVKFFDPIKKNNSKTFGTLDKTAVTNKEKVTKTLKADRKLIQQLFNASRAGKKIEMKSILKHELSVVPLSLAKTNGQMNSTSKSDLLNLISNGINTLSAISVLRNAKTWVIIDGHALSADQEEADTRLILHSCGERFQQN